MVLRPCLAREAVGNHVHWYHILQTLEKKRENSMSPWRGMRIHEPQVPPPAPLNPEIGGNGNWQRQKGGSWKAATRPKNLGWKAWSIQSLLNSFMSSDDLGAPHDFPLAVFNCPESIFLSDNKWKVLTLRVQSLLMIQVHFKNVFAFRAKKKKKSFDFPICASVQTSTENLLNIALNTLG